MCDALASEEEKSLNIESRLSLLGAEEAADEPMLGEAEREELDAFLNMMLCGSVEIPIALSLQRRKLSNGVD